MARKSLTVFEIGHISTPFKVHEGTPIQPKFSGAIGEVRIHQKYREALSDLNGFSYVWLIYWLDRGKPYQLKVIPYRDTVKRGLFSTRSPNRPNPIGISALEIISVDVESGLLLVKGVDMLDDTPLLDIKPYIPQDSIMDVRSGWFNNGIDTETADNRFSE